MLSWCYGCNLKCFKSLYRKGTLDTVNTEQPIINKHANILTSGHVKFHHQIKIATGRIKLLMNFTQYNLRSDLIGRTGPTAYLYKKTVHRKSFTFKISQKTYSFQQTVQAATVTTDSLNQNPIYRHQLQGCLNAAKPAVLILDIMVESLVIYSAFFQKGCIILQSVCYCLTYQLKNCA